jgi:hypothetical protein
MLLRQSMVIVCKFLYFATIKTMAGLHSGIRQYSGNPNVAFLISNDTQRSFIVPQSFHCVNISSTESLLR